jgi:hypothetical protein
MTRPFLMTYRDAIDHLVDYAGAGVTEPEQTRARGAVQSAYREVYLSHRWKYFITHGRLSVTAKYETGTVTYDHTGGTYERQLTLASGTWPSWARYGRIKITGYTPLYKIAERKSDTVVTLEPTFNPGADITDATAYTLFRSVYTLPGDLVRLEEIHDENNQWSGGYLDADTWLRCERGLLRSGKPFYWSVGGAPDLYGSLCLMMYGYPATAQSLDFIYYRRPQRLLLDGFQRYSSEVADTAVSTISGTTVTFTDWTANPTCNGAVFRWSDTAAAPTGLSGVNPYTLQRMIVDRPANKEYTLDSTAAAEWGGAGPDTGFCISDPIDFPDHLLETFLRACELYWVIKTDQEKVPVCRQLYDMARRQSKAVDGDLSPSTGSVLDWRAWKHPAWTYISGQVTPSASV